MNYLDSNHRPAEADSPELDNVVDLHLRLAHGAVYRHFTEIFSELDLTQKQLTALWLIDDNPNIAQADIGRRLHMDRTTVMLIINRLEKRGFVARGANEDDRRRQTLSITPEGYEALTIARNCINEHEQWLKSRFTPAESAMLVELLRKIHETDVAA